MKIDFNLQNNVARILPISRNEIAGVGVLRESFFSTNKNTSKRPFNFDIRHVGPPGSRQTKFHSAGPVKGCHQRRDSFIFISTRSLAVLELTAAAEVYGQVVIK